MSDAVLASLPCPREEARELGRLVLAFDGASPFNLASWFLARWFEMLRRRGVSGLVSFADPVPRTAADGTVKHKGHFGVTYQGSNAAFDGRASSRTLRLLPDGSVMSQRALSKIRSLDQGHAYAEAILVRAGAEPRGDQDPKVWLQRWLPVVTRPLRHPGNYRYLLGLDRATRKAITKQCERKYGGAMLPYPKVTIQPSQVFQ